MKICSICKNKIQLSNHCQHIKFEKNILITEKASFKINDDLRLLNKSNIESVKQRSQHLTKWLDNLIRRKFKYNKKVKILSIGCGLGYDVFYLNKLGYDIYGIEPVNRSSFWIKNFPTMTDNFSVSSDKNIPFKDKTFDVIFAGEVIEHVGTTDNETEINHKTFDRRKEFLNNLIAKLKNDGLRV